MNDIINHKYYYDGAFNCETWYLTLDGSYLGPFETRELMSNFYYDYIHG